MEIRKRIICPKYYLIPSDKHPVSREGRVDEAFGVGTLEKLPGREGVHEQQPRKEHFRS
jgi:hypothetical protein